MKNPWLTSAFSLKSCDTAFNINYTFNNIENLTVFSNLKIFHHYFEKFRFLVNLLLIWIIDYIAWQTDRQTKPIQKCLFLCKNVQNKQKNLFKNFYMAWIRPYCTIFKNCEKILSFFSNFWLNELWWLNVHDGNIICQHRRQRKEWIHQNTHACCESLHER